MLPLTKMSTLVYTYYVCIRVPWLWPPPLSGDVTPCSLHIATHSPTYYVGSLSSITANTGLSFCMYCSVHLCSSVYQWLVCVCVCMCHAYIYTYCISTSLEWHCTCPKGYTAALLFLVAGRWADSWLSNRYFKLSAYVSVFYFTPRDCRDTDRWSERFLCIFKNCTWRQVSTLCRSRAMENDSKNRSHHWRGGRELFGIYTRPM